LSTIATAGPWWHLPTMTELEPGCVAFTQKASIPRRAGLGSSFFVLKIALAHSVL
jgi:hypothetical protein